MGRTLPTPLSLTGREKIVIVPVNGIGDHLMFLPALWQLKRAAPQVHIGMLANGANGAAAAMRLARSVDTVHEYSLGGGNTAARAELILSEPTHCAALLRRERYDYVVTLVPNSFRKFILNFFPSNRQLVESDLKKNEYAAALGVVNRFAGLPPGGGYGELIRVPTAAKKRQRLGVPPTGYVLLCLDGKSAARRFTDEAGLAVAARKATGRTIVLASTHTAAIQAPSGVIDLRGRTNWAGFAAVMDGAAGVVAVDGGALHLAVAMAKPIVGLFGPVHSTFRTPPYFPAPWRALDAGPRGVVGYEGRGGYIHPLGTVEQLSQDAIIEALREILA